MWRARYRSLHVGRASFLESGSELRELRSDATAATAADCAARIQILLTRPAVNDEREDRVEFTLYYLKLAPWIVRPAPPPARAAIRTKFEVALKRSLPESNWSVVGIARRIC